MFRKALTHKNFFLPFNGTYRYRSYTVDVSPHMSFPNSFSCNSFRDFVSRTILEREANGSLLLWGEVGKADPAPLVMPITVEPSKPRMCHDERFLNCWIKNCPFSLDYIMNLPRYVGAGHYQTTFDDKSGYDHVCLIYIPLVLPFLGSNEKDGTLLYIFHFASSVWRQVYFSTSLLDWQRLVMYAY